MPPPTSLRAAADRVTRLRSSPHRPRSRHPQFQTAVRQFISLAGRRTHFLKFTPHFIRAVEKLHCFICLGYFLEHCGVCRIAFRCFLQTGECGRRISALTQLNAFPQQLINQ